MRRWRAAVVALAAVALAACGSASHGQDYSPGQVRAAFASEGISLHRNTNISEGGVYWLATRDKGREGGPAVFAVVITRPSAGQFSFSQKGGHAQLKRLGDVRVVWTKKALDARVEAALGKLGRDNAPAQPKPATTTSQAQPNSFAQTLAEIPAPLRAAVRKTAAAPSAHVTMTGDEITGSGDYSTVTQIGELHTKAFLHRRRRDTRRHHDVHAGILPWQANLEEMGKAGLAGGRVRGREQRLAAGPAPHLRSAARVPRRGRPRLEPG